MAQLFILDGTLLMPNLEMSLSSLLSAILPLKILNKFIDVFILIPKRITLTLEFTQSSWLLLLQAFLTQWKLGIFTSQWMWNDFSHHSRRWECFPNRTWMNLYVRVHALTHRNHTAATINLWLTPRNMQPYGHSILKGKKRGREMSWTHAFARIFGTAGNSPIYESNHISWVLYLLVKSS